MSRKGLTVEGQTADGFQDEAGRIWYYAHLQKPSSPSLTRKKVFLTIVAEEDGEILGKQGLAPLRQARIMRLCREAQNQGALLAYEDLISLLLTSLSTIKRDLRHLRKQGLFVPIHRKKQRPTKGA